MIGFETIGNATLIAYDDTPVLATDPWLDGSAYFGSWGRPFEIPATQRDAIERCPYVWISHGHPDHLCPETLERQRESTILLADHYGGRLQRELTGLGFKTRVLPSKKWVELSPRLRVLTFPDVSQDSVLVLDLDGRLILDVNDATDHGWAGWLKRLGSRYAQRYLLRINGFGDPQMINYFNEDGERVVPRKVYKRMQEGCGFRAQEMARVFGANVVVPFSFFHRYEREDSAWANEFVPRMDQLRDGFDATDIEYTGPFVRFDFEHDALSYLEPAPLEHVLHPPEEFGDSWSDELDADDRRKLSEYLGRFERLRESLRFINFRVGGKDFTVDIDPSNEWGITLETPRGSLMQSVEWQIFDDLFIGNYMKTTFHGQFSMRHLMPVLTRGDTGGVYTEAEEKAYLAYYRGLFPLGERKLRALRSTRDFLMARLPRHSLPYRAASRAFRMLR